MAAPLVDDGVCTKSKKTRKSHPKVKSGCVTCKYVYGPNRNIYSAADQNCRIRRKKCDETRPNCKRCTDTGRKCDGYDHNSSRRKNPPKTQLPTPPNSNPSSPDSVRSSVLFPRSSDPVNARSCLLGGELSHDGLDNATTCRLITVDPEYAKEQYLSMHSDSEDIPPPSERTNLFPQLVRNPSLSSIHTEREALCFDFFRERTCPEFTGFFDSSFWSGILLQACFYHPAVQQAVVALGAVHRRLELGITPEAFNYCDFALRTYTKAVSSLTKALGEGDPNSLELSMVGSMLFCAFETFQGNYSEASKHMTGGLKILFDRKLHRLSTSSSRTLAIFNSKTLRDLFSRLEEQAEVYFETSADFEDFLSDSAETVLPTHFDTLEQARNVLFRMVRQHLSVLNSDGRDDATQLKDRQEYVEHLFEWSCVYAEYFKRCKKHMSLDNFRAAMLLRIYREAAYMVLLVQLTPCTGGKPYTIHDDTYQNWDFRCRTERDRQEVIQAHFTKINSLADSLSDHTHAPGIGSQPCSFSSCSDDDKLSPPLYLASKRRRSTKTTHQAPSLLSRTARKVQAIGKLGAYAIAEKISAMEEGALHACGFLPADTHTTSIYVTVFLEERKFLMRYCVPNREDGSLTWTQDWFAF